MYNYETWASFTNYLGKEHKEHKPLTAINISKHWDSSMQVLLLHPAFRTCFPKLCVYLIFIFWPPGRPSAQLFNRLDSDSIRLIGEAQGFAHSAGLGVIVLDEADRSRSRRVLRNFPEETSFKKGEQVCQAEETMFRFCKKDGVSPTLLLVCRENTVKDRREHVELLPET